MTIDDLIKLLLNAAKSNKKLTKQELQEMQERILSIKALDGPKGTALNQKDDQGLTLLMHAMSNKQFALARLLIKARVNLDVQDNKGKTVLIRTIEERCAVLVRELIDAGADLGIQDNDESSALHLAFEKNLRDLASSILLKEKGEAHLNNWNRYKKTPLMLACQDGNLQMTLEVINAGVNLNTLFEYGKTAVMWAAMNGHHQIVEVLAKRKANLNLTNFFEETALSLAIEKRQIGSVRVLLEHGALIPDQEKLLDCLHSFDKEDLHVVACFNKLREIQGPSKYQIKIFKQHGRQEEDGSPIEKSQCVMM